MKLPSSLVALRHRQFRLYWGGQAISMTGTWMQIMAHGWIVTDLTRDAVQLGLLHAIGALPVLVLSMKGGEIADRFEKRRILLCTQVAMMLLAFAFSAVVFTHHVTLPFCFALSGLLGVAAAFDLPAAQAFPPELVDRAEIPNAVALMQSILHAARIVGPALAGFLIAHVRRGTAFLLNGLSFLAVIWTLLVIRPRAPIARPPRNGSMIAEGFAYVWRDTATLCLVTLTALVTGFVFPFLSVLMPYYVRFALGTDDSEVFGTLMSASGLGSFVGAAAILSGRSSTRRSWLAFGLAGASVGLVGLSFARVVPLIAACAFILSFSVSSLMGRAAQLVQERVPDELRGRVMGIYSLSFTGVVPAAAMFWSFLVNHFAEGEGFEFVMRISAGCFAALGTSVLAYGWRTLAPVVQPSEPAQPA